MPQVTIVLALWDEVVAVRFLDESEGVDVQSVVGGAELDDRSCPIVGRHDGVA